MPGLEFSHPDLAIIAYAEVDGATGAATRLNSGINIFKVPFAPGSYFLTMPTLLGTFDSNDLVVVQAKNNPGGSGVIPKNVVVYNFEYKAILFFDGILAGDVTPPFNATTIDSSFFVMILRTTIAAPGTPPLPV